LNIDKNEKRAKFDALPSPEVSSEKVRELSIAANTEPDGKRFAPRVFEWLRSINVLGSHVNAETGWDVEVNNSSVRSVISHGSGSGKVALLKAVPNLIKNGIYLESNPKNKEGLTSHIFAGKATVDEIPYAISYVVREDQNGRRYYDHSLTKTEALDRIDGQAPKKITDESHKVTAQIFRPEAKSAGEESTVNILKKHLCVNTQNKL